MTTHQSLQGSSVTLLRRSWRQSWSGRAAWLAAPALAGLLTGLLAGGVWAGNFGSNVPAPGEPGHGCDNHTDSQCVANNNDHTVYKYYLGAAMSAATDSAIATANGLPGIGVRISTTSLAYSDVVVHQGNYGDTGWWGYTACHWDGFFGGAAPNDLWCYPQDIVFNLTSNFNWDGTQQGRNVVACHEMGHTFGLRHIVASSCMEDAQVDHLQYLNPHEWNLVDAQY